MVTFRIPCQFPNIKMCLFSLTIPTRLPWCRLTITPLRHQEQFKPLNFSPNIFTTSFTQITMATTSGPKANQSHFPILSLPEEVLSSILDLVIKEETHPRNVFKNRLQTTARLSETCQRFRDTLTPKLYSKLHVVPNVVDEHNELVLMDLNDKGRTSTSRLHRTLTSNPQLGTHCKTLEVWFDQTNTLCVPLREFILSDATFDFRN